MNEQRASIPLNPLPAPAAKVKITPLLFSAMVKKQPPAVELKEVKFQERESISRLPSPHAVKVKRQQKTVHKAKKRDPIVDCKEKTNTRAVNPQPPIPTIPRSSTVKAKTQSMMYFAIAKKRAPIFARKDKTQSINTRVASPQPPLPGIPSSLVIKAENCIRRLSRNVLRLVLA
jgi:hypothetical protein